MRLRSKYWNRLNEGSNAATTGKLTLFGYKGFAGDRTLLLCGGDSRSFTVLAGILAAGPGEVQCEEVDVAARWESSLAESDGAKLFSHFLFADSPCRYSAKRCHSLSRF